MVWPFTYLVLPPPSGELSEDVEAASETTTDQEDQTKDRESGGEKELTKGTGKAEMRTHMGFTVTGDACPPTSEWYFCQTNHFLGKHWQHLNYKTLVHSTVTPHPGHRLAGCSAPSDSTRMNFHRSCDTGFVSVW